MNKDKILLELDYSKQKKGKRFIVAFVSYFSLVLFFVLLGSYENPTLRINNELVDRNQYQFQNTIKFQINSLNNNLETDSINDLNAQLSSLLIQFYESRNYKPAWIQNYETNNQFNTLINLLDSANYFGFPIDYFGVENVHELQYEFLLGRFINDLLKPSIDLEMATTFSALKFMFYLEYGIIENDSTPNILNNTEILPELLNKALRNNLRNEILSVQPNLVHHRNLLNSLSHFIDLHYSVKYTTPAFIDDKLLAKSLYYSGLTESPLFDSTNLKSEALYKLETEYSLPKDSILNIPTHEVLVSLLEYRYFQACLNLNRLRTLKQSGENYLFVNIPEFKLHVIEENEAKETFNVIVGKKKTPTPVLSSTIKKVVANPYWTVPRSIVNNEMLYKIRKDSTYLEKRGYFIINNREEIVDESIIDWNANDPLGNAYWIRQINSRLNALGQVKFIFPNDYSVYLHDTPSKSLFTQKNRTFSHGCIRLENPDKLAQYITDQYNSHDEQNIESLISKNERHVIDLSEEIKIHVQYITCSGAENSDMVFFNDIYDLDEEEIKATFSDQLEI